MTKARDSRFATLAPAAALLTAMVGTWLVFARPAVNESARAAAVGVTEGVTKSLSVEVVERKAADEKMDARYNDRMKRIEDGVAELLRRTPDNSKGERP